MIRNSRWTGQTPEERGKEAEEKFFQAWNNPKYLSNWMIAIERPTTHEDVKRKTDAVIICHPGPNLKIQIKSYWLTREERDQLMTHDVVVLCILPKYSLAKIRKLTKIAIRIFYSYLDSPEYVSQSFVTTQQADKSYYKYGKKKYHKSKPAT